MTEIDKELMVYFGGIRDPKLYDKIIPKLLEKGFLEKKIIRESASKLAQNGDYIVIPSFPNNPNELIIGKVKKSETIDPQSKGDGQIDMVQYDELFRISL